MPEGTSCCPPSQLTDTLKHEMFPPEDMAQLRLSGPILWQQDLADRNFWRKRRGQSPIREDGPFDEFYT